MEYFCGPQLYFVWILTFQNKLLALASIYRENIGEILMKYFYKCGQTNFRKLYCMKAPRSTCLTHEVLVTTIDALEHF